MTARARAAARAVAAQAGKILRALESAICLADAELANDQQ